MKYYCAQCGKPLRSGISMCVCGQLFQHEVPEEGDGVGAQYWPPRRPSAAEDYFRRIREGWEHINPNLRAAGLGVIALIIVSIGWSGVVGHYRELRGQADVPRPVALSPIPVAPMPYAPPVSSPRPTTPVPVVLSASPASTSRPTSTPGYYDMVQCPHCGGTGRCIWCNGTGKSSDKNDFGNYMDCDECHGTGQCGFCHGTGKMAYYLVRMEQRDDEKMRNTPLASDYNDVHNIQQSATEVQQQNQNGNQSYYTGQ